MPRAPGKYDVLCTHVRLAAKARGAIVIVFGGDQGDGFSAQLDLMDTLGIPELLERVAADIRRDFERGKT